MKYLAYLFGGALIVSSFFFTHQAHAASYSYYRSITVTSTASIASGTNTNFPMLFSGTYTWLEPTSTGGRIQNLVTAPNGGQEPADLIFSTSNSCASPLSYETESYTSSTGAIVDWVNVPSLAAGTAIYACYGNSAVTTDQSHPSSTWNGNYASVYHLPNGTTLSGKDSTANAINPITVSSTATTTIIGGGASFLGVSFIQYPTSTMNSPTTTFTLSSWFNEIGSLGNKMIISHGPTPIAGWSINMNTLIPRLSAGSTALVSCSAATTANAWHYAAATVSTTGSFRTLVLYLDGTQCGTATTTTAFATSKNIYIGADSTSTNSFNGSIDEVRIANAVQTPSWVLTEYNDQKSPATFYAVGNETVASTYVWTGGGGNANWSTTGNWSSSIVPGSGNVAIFDGTCSSNCSPTIDVPESVGGVSVSSTYTGTITQASGSGLTIGASGYSQSGGKFVGSSNTGDVITVNGSLALSSGTFTSTAGNLAITGNLAIASGTFNANAGTVTFQNASAGSSETLSCNSNPLNVVVQNGASTNTLNFSTSTPCVFAGNFSVLNGNIGNPSSSYSVTLKGNYIQSNSGGTVGGSNLTLLFAGSSTSTITATAGTFNANLNIGNTGSAPVQLASDLTVASGTCAVSTGTLDMNSHNFTCGGALTINAGGWLADYATTSSTLNVSSTVTNNGVIFFDGSGTGCSSTLPQYVSILSTASGTQRSWSGTGRFVIRYANVQDQAGSAAITVWNGTSVANNSGGWTFSSGNSRAQLVASTTVAVSGSGASSLALPVFSYPPKPGDLIVVAVSAYNASTTAPTDSAGNTYFSAASSLFGSPLRQVGLYYANNTISTSSFVVTLHGGGGGGSLLSGAAYEFAGMAASSTFDTAAQNSDVSGNAVALTSANTTGHSTQGELYFGASTVSANSDAVTSGSGWTSLPGVQTLGTQEGLSPEYQTPLTTSTLSATWNAAASTSYAAVIGVFAVPSTASPGYAASGTLDSAVFDTQMPLGAQLNSITWNGVALNGTSVGFQIAASSTSGGPWTFVGPSGDGTTYFGGLGSLPGTAIPLVSYSGGRGYAMFSGYRYFRYRIILMADAPYHQYTPTVTGVNVNWSP